MDGGVERAGDATSQGPSGKIFEMVLFFLTTPLQAGLENSRGGGIQLAWADREHDAQALTGEDAMSAVCEWLSLWFASVNYIHHCLHNMTPHFQTLIFFSRVLTGRPTGNCWRPWWDWRRAMPGDRRQSTRWMSCRWRCWRWWSTFSKSETRGGRLVLEEKVIEGKVFA